MFGGGAFGEWLLAVATPLAAILTAQTSVPPGVDGPALAAARQLDSIAAYTRWPDAPTTLDTCIAGDSALADRLVTHRLPDGRTLAVTRIGAEAVTPARCDIAVIGRVAAAQRDRIIRDSGGTAMLTVTDADPGCVRGFMICWAVSPAGLGFDINIGAVARSRLRIDPRVLALGRRGSAP